MDMKTIATYVYTDSDIAQKEQHLLSNNWILAGLSSQLPENSTVMVIRILHTSILLSRDELGVVHAMENSCVHRGTQILSDKQAKKWKGISASKLHCRYHGWEYNMHGILQHVPKREKIVCTTSALRKFMVREQYGCIWVCLSAPSIPVEALLGEFESKIAHYNFAEMEAIEAKDFHFSVNWKIALEWLRRLKICGGFPYKPCTLLPILGEKNWTNIVRGIERIVTMSCLVYTNTMSIPIW
jgi:phenylpropionate dioxygenase-like ring-hydroxylating dioxygenase large terminal subunit